MCCLAVSFWGEEHVRPFLRCDYIGGTESPFMAATFFQWRPTLTGLAPPPHPPPFFLARIYSNTKHRCKCKVYEHINKHWGSYWSLETEPSMCLHGEIKCSAVFRNEKLHLWMCLIRWSFWTAKSFVTGWPHTFVRSVLILFPFLDSLECVCFSTGISAWWIVRHLWLVHSKRACLVQIFTDNNIVLRYSHLVFLPQYLRIVFPFRTLNPCVEWYYLGIGHTTNSNHRNVVSSLKKEKKNQQQESLNVLFRGGGKSGSGGGWGARVATQNYPWPETL